VAIGGAINYSNLELAGQERVDGVEPVPDVVRRQNLHEEAAVRRAHAQRVRHLQSTPLTRTRAVARRACRESDARARYPAPRLCVSIKTFLFTKKLPYETQPRRGQRDRGGACSDSTRLIAATLVRYLIVVGAAFDGRRRFDELRLHKNCQNDHCQKHLADKFEFVRRLLNNKRSR